MQDADGAGPTEEDKAKALALERVDPVDLLAIEEEGLSGDVIGYS